MLPAIVLLIFSFSVSYGCGKKEKVVQKNARIPTSQKAKITFIELGSVNCVPCRKMQPILKDVEQKYGNQIEVIFYDVWKPDQRKFFWMKKVMNFTAMRVTFLRRKSTGC